MTRRDGWAALAYLGVYLVYLFHHLESDAMHWVTLVAIPLGIVVVVACIRRRGRRSALASVGLRRHRLLHGLGLASLLGIAITVFQAIFGRHAPEIRELVADGRAALLFPLTVVLMLATAGFTEEFFFRGFLQTRLERLLGSRWGAMALATFLFALYHLPYALLHPSWPSHGDWGAAVTAALVEGTLGGLLLGSLYVLGQGNLLACVLLHALVNAGPAMTMIRLGGP